MAQLEHLPFGARDHAKRRRWDDARVDQLVADFFRRNPIRFIENHMNLPDMLSAFFCEEANREDILESEDTMSLLLEWCGPSKFRAIVFETDWLGRSSVRDVAEYDKLSALKKWFLKTHPDVKCVSIGMVAREVRDVFLTASCLMQKTYDETVNADT